MDPWMEKRFDWMEYTVCGLMLGISVLIGIYFGWFKGGQNTVSEYLLGSRKMSVFPITMSLIASQISTFTLLGVPTEIYTYGMQFAAVVIANILSGFITLYLFLPVFYKLRLISIFEYLELRFSHSVRIVTSILCILSVITFLPIVMYGPALALNQVSGINLHVVTTVLFGICIFYTTFGGLRAVVWTDTLQTLAMVLAVFTIMFLGTAKAGGFWAVIEAAKDGDRLNLFDMDPDPTKRLSFWTMLFGITVTWTGYLAVQPGSVQRFIALPTYGQARKAVMYVAFGINIFSIPCLFLGLIVYAIYKDCDPLTNKLIQRSDQIVPYFVVDVAGHIRGLSGLFIVGLISASLSTVSTGLNSLAGVIYEDMVLPWLPKKQTDAAASRIMKLLVLLLGVLCLVLVLLFEKLGPILELTTSFGGVTMGAILGVFALGMLFPTANNKGAIIGGLASITVMTWLLIGNTLAVQSGRIHYAVKPVSVEGCRFNLTHYVDPKIYETTMDGVFYPYRISLFYYGLMGCLLTVVTGIVVSHLTGPLKCGEIHQDLLNPLVHRFIPKEALQNYSIHLRESPQKKVYT